MLVYGAVTNTGNGAIQIGFDGTLGIIGGTISGNVQFTGSSATLALMNTQSRNASVTGDVVGAVAGDNMTLKSVAFLPAVQAIWQQNGSAGTLSLVNNGSTLATLTLSGQYTSANFTAVSDAHNGTLIEVVNPPPPSTTTADMIMYNASGNLEILRS